MLEYAKTILSKVCFSKSLLEKEYKKALNYLSQEECQKLKKWYSKTFYMFKNK